MLGIPLMWGWSIALLSLVMLIADGASDLLRIQIGRRVGAETVKPFVRHVSRDTEKVLHLSAGQHVMVAEPLVKPLPYLLLRLLGGVSYTPPAGGVDEMVAMLVQLLEKLLVGRETDGVDADVIARDFVRVGKLGFQLIAHFVIVGPKTEFQVKSAHPLQV